MFFYKNIANKPYNNQDVLFIIMDPQIHLIREIFLYKMS